MTPTGGSSIAGVLTERERPAPGPVAGRHRRDASRRSATDSASATPRGGKVEGLGGKAPSTRRHHANPFFHNLLTSHHHEDGQGKGEVEEIPAFDLLLVRNGLPRGRIRGRCSLLLGPGKDGGGGGNFRRGSVGFYGVGTGMTSVAGGQGDGVGDGAGVGSDGKVNGHGINGGREGLGLERGAKTYRIQDWCRPVAARPV